MTALLAKLARVTVAVLVAVAPLAACGSSVRTAVPAGGERGVPENYPVNILDSAELREVMRGEWERLFQDYAIPADRRRLPDLRPFTYTPSSTLGVGPIPLGRTATGAPLDEERIRLLLREFIAKHALLLGVAANNISLEQVASAGQIGKRYSFVQAGFAHPIAPPYGRLEFVVSDAGEIIQISDTAIPVADLPADPRVSRDAARQLVVGRTFTYPDLAGRPQQATVSDPNQVSVKRLVVYPEETDAALRLRLAWEVTAGEGLSWTVYVDAITGDIVGELQNFQS